MFTALPEEEKGSLRATCFAPLLLIDTIATMSTLVAEIFDRNLGDMKFQFGEMIIKMKPIHVCQILGLHVSPIANEFLFIDPEYMTNFRRRRCSSIKFVKNYTILSPPEQGEKYLGEWKKGEEKDNDDKKDVKEKVKSEKDEMEESKNGDEKVDGDEKLDDVAEEEDSEQPTVVVYYTEKKMYNTMVVAEASADQTTVISIEEHTLEVEKTEDEASQTNESKEEEEQNKKEFVLMESEVDVTLKKRHALNKEDINESVFNMACRMNQLHAYLDELLPGVLLESFIQRPISQDKKNKVDQVWSLRKDDLSLEAKKNNRSTYMMESLLFIFKLSVRYSIALYH
ncbi:hypothetical protein GIB67_031540 [Kingdonia uniflora]|uniref:Uncharacterized protein n=1 Tax=Kingdonia uniflora TaxID=39325 RepID=A0A7J7PBD1_9MAGN|nr:hypothetical protein GIB67_031540 [Kingdonia uniflora]